MLASRLRRGDVRCAIVGADRIAANGDVANKIGTYGLALAARAHGVPFYVAAPSSTIDLATPDGGAHSHRRARRRAEVARLGVGARAAPEAAGTGIRRSTSRRPSWSPAIITETGGVRAFRGRWLADDRGSRGGPQVTAPRMPSILALDQGTTGSTALVIHQDGSVLGRGYREFTQHFPRPGWVEHDPEEIFRVSVEAMREALAAGGRAPGRPRDHESAGDGGSLGPQDTRAGGARRSSGRTGAPPSAAGSSRDAGIGPMLRARTGLVRRPYFSATKFEWLLRDAEPAPRAERGELAAGTVESWIVAKSHRWASARDGSHQRRRAPCCTTSRSRTWAPELLATFGVPSRVLGEIVRSAGVVAEMDPAHLGFPFPSPGSPATSRRRCSGREAAPAKVSRRTPTGPERSSWSTPAQRLPTPAPGVLATAACGPARRAGLRARGKRVHRRCRDAMAARRPRHHRGRRGERGPGP